MSKRDNKIKNITEEIIVNAAKKSAEDNRKREEKKVRIKNNKASEHQSYKTILPKSIQHSAEVERLKKEIDTLKEQKEQIEILNRDIVEKQKEIDNPSTTEFSVEPKINK